ncbi:transcriptional regulator [Aeromonas caviae]
MTRYVIAGKITFNPHLYTLGNIDGHDLRLSSKESEVLELLCQHQATTVTRQFLFEHAWPNASGTDGHLNRIILLLRRKFDVLGETDAIKTVPKVGYILADAVAFLEESASGEDENYEKNMMFDGMHDIEYHVEYHFDSKSMLDNPIFISKDEAIQPEPEAKLKRLGYSSPSLWTRLTTKKRIYIYGCALLFSFILVFMHFYFKSNAGDGIKNDYYVGVNQSLIKNFLVLTPVGLDRKVSDDVKNIISNLDKTVDGKVYVGISPNVISLMHVNDTDETKIKKLFISDEIEPVEILKCALLEEFGVDSVDNIELPPKGSVHINKNSTVKVFNSDVISDCSRSTFSDVKTNREMLFTLSLTLNTDKSLDLSDNRYRFFYADFSFSYKGHEVLNTTASGNMRKEIIGSDSWDVWMIKAKNVVSFDTSSVTENTSSLKMLSDFANKDSAVYALKLDEGIYYIDFFGGIVVSTR